MRCLTLANALRERGAYTRFVCRSLPEHLKKQLQAEGHELSMISGACSPEANQKLPHSLWMEASQEQDAMESAKALADKTWDWIVVDHYALGIEWESKIRMPSMKILVIDDLADRQHCCDVLLDQNFSLNGRQRYESKVPPHAKLLLGPRFALLRKEFPEMRKGVVMRTGPVKRIFVFFGGVDADNYTGRTLAVLVKFHLTEIHVDVVVGAEHPQKEDIGNICDRYGFALYAQTDRMASLMASADLCIGAGGGATWERCCLGLPAIAVSIAKNQDQQLVDAASEGLLFLCDSERKFELALEMRLNVFFAENYLRSVISLNAMRAVDGHGASRVAAVLCRGDIEVKLATHLDSRQLFEWRNHAAIRMVSRNTEPVLWEAHQEWFAGVLDSPGRVLLVGYKDDAPVGMVRFDFAGEQAEISIYVDPELINRGIGRALLTSAEGWLATNKPNITTLCAAVLGANAQSHSLFVRGGYEMKSAVYEKGSAK